MLMARPTRYGGGTYIWGDYWDLRSLHETIHNIVGQAALSEELGDTILGLAYDVRKALERKREEERFGHDVYDTVTYRGVRVLWPTILFQVSVLRASAAVSVLTKGDQANLFRLEHCISSSLNQLNPSVAEECSRWVPYLSPKSPDYLVGYLEEVNYQYLFARGAGKRRVAHLPAILATMLETSDEYAEFRSTAFLEARVRDCRPDEIRVTRVWPKFRW